MISAEHAVSFASGGSVSAPGAAGAFRCGERAANAPAALQGGAGVADKFFVWDGPDGAALGEALKIMAANPCVGMLISGVAGNGKTTAVRQYGAGAWFWDCNGCSDADQDFLAGEDRYVYVRGRNAIVDDLGAEREYREYGKRRELVGEWLAGLYAAWKRGDWRHRLFVTTNLDSRAVAERYGGPVLDRLLEMCVAVRFTGRSKRQMANRLPRAASLEEAIRALCPSAAAGGGREVRHV